MKSAKKQNKKRYLYAILILVVIGFLIYLLIKNININNLIHGSPKVTQISSPIRSLPTTTSTVTKSPSTSTTINQGTSTDKNGQIPVTATSNSSQWSTSSSGVITVRSPLRNSIFSNGGTLAGTANVKQVQYTLIDNQDGVISQGFINVINNNFSATISFSSHSSNGRLDVFSTDQSGREINEVQIDVNL